MAQWPPFRPPASMLVGTSIGTSGASLSPRATSVLARSLIFPHNRRRTPSFLPPPPSHLPLRCRLPPSGPCALPSSHAPNALPPSHALYAFPPSHVPYASPSAMHRPARLLTWPETRPPSLPKHALHSSSTFLHSSRAHRYAFPISAAPAAHPHPPPPFAPLQSLNIAPAASGLLFRRTSIAVAR